MHNNTPHLKTKLQLYFVQKIKDLNSDSQSSLKNTFQFACLIECIVGKESDNREEVFDEFLTHFSSYSLNEIKNEFQKSFYSICLHEMLSSIDGFNAKRTDSEANISVQDVKNSILKIITATNYSDSFKVIYEFCVNLKPSQHKDFCLHLMKFFFE